MASPMDSRYLKSPRPSRSMEKDNSVSPEKRLSFENLSRDEQDEIGMLRMKISQMQSQQADRAFQYNEDCKSLELQVTNLRASVEKGEVLKQKLEYELTLLQRNLANEKRKFSEKESNLQKSNSSLKEKVDQLEDEANKLQKSFKMEKEEWAEEAKKYKEKESKKESDILQLRQMSKKLMESEHALKRVKTENEIYIKELQEKLKTLETQRDSQNDTIRRLMRDVEFSSGQEERLESELFKHQEKIKQYEENIESERSSHLETKFNFELLQVRIKELEATEESLRDCRNDLDNITRDYKELQHAMDEQVETCKELRNVIERRDRQHNMEVNEMGMQLEEMKKKENVLSEQFDIHQSNFDSLKSELIEAKKHQTSVESTYNLNMKELEAVLSNFKLERSNEEVKKKESSKKKRRSSSSLLEDLRLLLRDYQTKLMETNTQIEVVKKGNDSLTNENQRWKQRLKEKDKTLEETRAQLKSFHMESARHKAECLKYENDRTQQSEECNKVTRRLGDMKEKNNQLYLEMEDLQETLSKTHEDHGVFLYGIYQHLITGKSFIYSRKDNHMTSFSTSELCQMIQEQINFNLNSLKTAEEKILKLEKSLEDYQEDCEKLRHTLEKNSTNSTQKEDEMKRQIQELEDHYKRKINEMQKRTDRSRVTLDEVCVKLDKTKQSRVELKSENRKIQDVVCKLKDERGCLQLAGVLLSASLRSFSVQLVDLSLQQVLSNKLLKSYIYLKQQIIDLVDILRTEVDESHGNIRPKSMHVGRKMPLLLRFRRAVVVVLAANRFYHHANCAPYCINIGRCLSGMKSKHMIAISCKDQRSIQMRGLSHAPITRHHGPYAVVEWLTNPDFVSVALNSTHDLRDEVKKMPKSMKEVDNDDIFYNDDYRSGDYDKGPIAVPNIKEKIRKSYKTLINGLCGEFPASVYENNIYVGDDTLAYHLGLGLRKSLQRLRKDRDENPYISSVGLGKTINAHILAFIERLHAAEVERRCLRKDISRVMGEREDFEQLLTSERALKASLAKEDTLLKRKVEKLQDNMRNMIEASKYDALLSDMKSAMEKEEKAQKQLENYARQLECIEKRVEKHSLEEQSKDATMKETLKMLNNAKNEINKRDDIIRRLKKDSEICEKEKTLYHSNLDQVEKAYKAAVREREIVASYIGAVGTVLEQSRQQAKLSSTDKFDFMLPELILPNEILVMDGIQMSKDMLLCQDTVRLFYQAQNLALQEISRLCNEKKELMKKIDILSNEIRSQRDSVMEIRGEMNALKVANASHMRNIPSQIITTTDCMKSKAVGGNMHDLRYSLKTFASSPPNGFFPLLSSEKT